MNLLPWLMHTATGTCIILRFAGQGPLTNTDKRKIPFRSRSRGSYTSGRHRLPPRPPVPPVDHHRRFDDYDYRSSYEHPPLHYSDRDRSYDTYHLRDS
jgi:hypothetical protein